jgi:pyrroline-5-carboxylate reductase
MRITFIGGGNLATALIGGLTGKAGNTPAISVIEPLATQRESLHTRFGARCFAAPEAAAFEADVLVMAVKPQHMREAAQACAAWVSNQLVISVAAGIRIPDLERWLGGRARIIRAMPNTPALIGMGVSGLYASSAASEHDRATAESILRSVGQTVWVNDESLIDAVTAVSGSGPAYVFRFIEAIEQAGIQLGLSAADARALTIATFRGAAELAARSDEPPSTLRERVTSRGGTTAAGLSVMDQGDLNGLLERAVNAACRRGAEMGDEFGRSAPGA